jgi:hypothetical protein
MDAQRIKRLAAMFAGAVALVAVVGFLRPGTSAASTSSTSCPWGPLTQPFLHWNDSGQYFLASGGNFEGAMTGWTLAGSAGTTSGNESSHVGAPGDSRSLALPTVASSATTPMICVTTQSPDLRFFALNTGIASAQLVVYVNYTGADGKLHSVKIAAIKGVGSSWVVIPQISFIAYVREPLQNGNAWVSFTFKPNGTQSHWQIDDLYVDPLKSQ